MVTVVGGERGMKRTIMYESKEYVASMHIDIEKFEVCLPIYHFRIIEKDIK